MVTGEFNVSMAWMVLQYQATLQLFHAAMAAVLIMIMSHLCFKLKPVSS